ncbi:uncharacterized protein J2W34_002539 [Variovorax boronicumulans]|uniref:lysozyme inhibitor LprI family protein n=1 Tax=Variovorax boronicumulans TaxID=436515 RepID=UPI00278191C7|nr:lysozyme inhibitor LprI family protein [Variovorax boronicumulans]MDQ0070754.1 uncharacterized protein [Variovorax boronicumulans]
MRINEALARLTLGVFMAAGISLANAASFDCTKAGNATEKAICADPGLSRQDEALAALYQRQLEMPDTGQWAVFLRRDQRDWIAGRNGECRRDTECLKRDYERRIAYLSHPLRQWMAATCRANARTRADSSMSRQAMPGNSMWRSTSAPTRAATCCCRAGTCSKLDSA